MESLTLSQPREPRHELVIAAVGSILFHGLVIAAAFLVPAMLPKPTYQTPYYSVNLVNMKELGLGSGASPKGAKHTQGPAAHSGKTSHGANSKTVKPSAMVPVKKLHFDKTSPQSNAQIEKLKVPEMPEVPVSSADNSALDKEMDQLISKPKPSASPAKQTAQQSQPSQSKSAAQASKHASEHAAGGSSVTSTSNKGGQIGLARRLYYTEVWNAISSQWALPDFLKSQKLEAILVLTVRRDGKIVSVRFQKKSGNNLFDESVLRAVRKADPLPPFPKIYSPPEEQIGIRFRPQDLG